MGSRPIKYRIWDKHSKTMVPVLSIHFGEEGDPRTVVLDSPGYGRVFGESAELLQYTGLKDKNGREIYEGDVVKTAPTPWLTTPHLLLRVFWWSTAFSDWDARFGLCDLANPATHWFSFCDIRESKLFPVEVVGTIYEHPYRIRGITDESPQQCGSGDE